MADSKRLRKSAPPSSQGTSASASANKTRKPLPPPPRSEQSSRAASRSSQSKDNSAAPSAVVAYVPFTSVASPKVPSTVASGPFSIGTKKKIMAAVMCFMCPKEASDSCHIIEQSDKAISFLVERGLINFNLTSSANGIALCAACHREYDHSTDPQIAFYPEDIDFFIRFELRDRYRRREHPELGRTVPTARDYAEVGGKYARVRFPWHAHREAVIYAPATWPGAPLAALRRAMAATGSPRGAIGFPYLHLVALRTLQDLYFRDDETLVDAIAGIYRTDPLDNNFGLEDENERPASVMGIEADATEDDEQEEGEDFSYTHDWEEVDQLESSDNQSEAKADQPHRRRALSGTEKSLDWAFGPKSTSQTKSMDYVQSKSRDVILLGLNSFNRFPSTH